MLAQRGRGRTGDGSDEMKGSVMEERQDIQAQGQEPKVWPKVAIIVLNWNGWRDTIECLESLQRLTYPNYQVVVVDNGSTDESVEKIKAWAKGEIRVESNFFEYDSSLKPIHWVEYDENISTFKASEILMKESLFPELPCSQRLVLIRIGRNLGFAGGNNVGIRYALISKCDYVFILNNDTVVKEEALTEMIKIILQNPKLGMVAPVVYHYHQPDLIDRLGIVLTKAGLGYDRKSKTDGPLLCPSGCAALYSRTLLLAIACNDEYFDEDFFAYCEDMDLGIRAQLRGFEAALADRAIIFHKGGRSLGGPGSKTSIYLGHRNTIWTIAKNYPANVLIRNILWIILGQIGGLIKNFGHPQLWVVVRGKVDGVKGLRKMCLKRKVCSKGDKCGRLPIDKRLFLVR